MQTWNRWKQFPDAEIGEPLEAPIGPGVYEVRDSVTGRVIAFGPANNVAQTLSGLKVNGGLIARLFRRRQPEMRVADLEYRTCTASSRAEAKAAAHRLIGLRQMAWRRNLDFGWARLPS